MGRCYCLGGYASPGSQARLYFNRFGLIHCRECGRGLHPVPPGRWHVLLFAAYGVAAGLVDQKPAHVGRPEGET